MNNFICLWISALFFLTGCSPTTLKEISRKEAPLKTTAQSIETNTNGLQPDDSGPLDLAKAISLALTGSPELQAFSFNVRVAESRQIQAGIIPNPEISIVLEDVLGSGIYKNGRQAQTTLLLSQIVELGGKRSAREEVAGAFIGLNKDEYEIKRLEVLSEVTDKFLEVVSDGLLLELSAKAEQLAKDVLKNIKIRAAAGVGSDMELSKAEVLLARARIAFEHAEHELESSKLELATMWGSDTVNFSKLKADLFKPFILPPFDELESRIEQSSEMKRWVSEQRLREAEEKLAFSKRIPNFQLGAGPRRLEGQNAEAFVFQLSMPLPIFDRNQGGIAEANNLKERSVIEEHKDKLRLKSALFSLYQEVKHALTESEAMKEKIIPQAEKGYRVAQEGYNQGRFSYLELLDAQRTLLEVYREQIEAAYTFHHFANSIERLLGAPINVGARAIP